MAAGPVETWAASTARMKEGSVHQSRERDPVYGAGAAAANPAAPTRRSTRQMRPSVRL